MSVKRGFLLLEVLITLVILSIVIGPLYQFLIQNSRIDTTADMDLFFKTKKVFLIALDHQIDSPLQDSPSIYFKITEKPLSPTESTLKVDSYKNNTLRYSLVGIK
jgi:prepilin-type N-terminal cleavage/methylation domain-containing protein